MNTTPTVPTVALHDGTTIPQLGFGTLNIPDGAAEHPNDDATAAIVSTAIDAGYRHLDSAQGYKSEVGVGRAVRGSGVPRSEFYITTKLANDHHRPDDVRRTFEDSLRNLNTDYVDLFLMHWPVPGEYDGDYVSTWRAMAELRDQGHLRSVGVANFQPAHLERIIGETGIVPVVDQVELHPQFANTAVADTARHHGIAIEAWSPIAQGRYLDDPTISGIATDLGRSPAQVILRWHLEHEHIIFPKTQTPARMIENLQVLDFTLTADQVAAIDRLDRGEDGRNGPNPDTFNWIP